MIELGQRIKDRITGFEGIAIARVEYLTGCIQYCIKPEKLDEKGKMIEGEYIDEGQLEILDDGVNKSAKDWAPTTPTNGSNGGFMSDMPKDNSN